jgi:hypothetical protein
MGRERSELPLSQSIDPHKLTPTTVRKQWVASPVSVTVRETFAASFGPTLEQSL